MRPTTTTRRPLGALVLVLAASGCDQATAPRAEARCADGPSADEREQNLIIFEGLKPACEGCHITGARGYFASIESFEALVAYDPAVVVAGDPDGSPLVKLLEGKGDGAFVQMPPGGPTYADLVDAGLYELDMADIRAWVTDLGDHGKNPNPLASAPRIVRISAPEIQRALYQQLGLDDDDFFSPATNYSVPHKTSQGDEKYPMSSADAIPAPFETLPVERFASLGGGSAMYQRKVDPTLSPSFVGTLSQVSQRWCALAIDKADNTALFDGGATSTTGSADAAAVKAVITRWFMHFHATKADPDEVDRVFDALFVPLEAGADSRTAWIGTCSYFIRHPDWVFY